MAALLAFPGYEVLAGQISAKLQIPQDELLVRHFPDGESLVRLGKKIAGEEVIVVCGLDNPDAKAMSLMFIAEQAREMDAVSVGIVAPYLGYMRQDKRFRDGEAVSAQIFPKFISRHFDWLVTVDPHLHRIKDLAEVYTIPATVVSASPAIAKWIIDKIDRPLLIGPDEESKQWVAAIAEIANAPYVVLEKTRYGDTKVEISLPDIAAYTKHQPILVDDIISTANTMIVAVQQLRALGMAPPVCVGVHAVFADDAYARLLDTGVAAVVTCNTIVHQSNGIDLSDYLAEKIR